MAALCEIVPLLIIGGDALIGGALVETCRRNGTPWLASTRRRAVALPPGFFHLDLEDDWKEWSLPRPPKADSKAVAVLCAAITGLVACQDDPKGTAHINVIRTIRLAKMLSDDGWQVVFISTSLVFSGKTQVASPNAPLNPLTEYGCQKARAEELLSSLNPKPYIIRPTKIVHCNLALFSSWRQKILAGQTITTFNDFWLAPVFVENTVEAILETVTTCPPGVRHISSPDAISYTQAAEILFPGQEFRRLIQAQSALPFLDEAFIVRYPVLPTELTFPNAAEAIRACRSAPRG